MFVHGVSSSCVILDSWIPVKGEYKFQMPTRKAFNSFSLSIKSAFTSIVSVMGWLPVCFNTW